MWLRGYVATWLSGYVAKGSPYPLSKPFPEIQNAKFKFSNQSNPSICLVYATLKGLGGALHSSPKDGDSPTFCIARQGSCEASRSLTPSRSLVC